MDAENPAARLTEREKEALRLWLQHRTAKEIAIALSISHHAVEKRLKMARTKLGVASSLEAARMLAEAEDTAERYQPTVTDPPDLHEPPLPRHARQYRPVILGGIAMSLAIVLALVFVAAPQSDPATEPANEAGTIELNPDVEPLFNYLDRDNSGYLENAESPFVDMAFVDPDNPTEQSTAVLGDKTDPDQIAEFYAEADTDGDKRVSFREFYTWNKAHLAELGIEVESVLKLRPIPES